MNLCQDTLQSTGKLLFHKAEEIQQLEKQQQVQTAFPPKLGTNTNEMPVASSNGAGVLFQGWLELTCGPTQHFQHILTSHSFGLPKDSNILILSVPVPVPSVPAHRCFHHQDGLQGTHLP